MGITVEDRLRELLDPEFLESRTRDVSASYTVKEPEASPAEETDEDLNTPCAACGAPFGAHTPPGVRGACPERVPETASQNFVDREASEGVHSAAITEASGQAFPQPLPASVSEAITEEMQKAARASWQWASLEAMEDLRLCIVQDAPRAVLLTYRALRDSIAADMTGISPDVLPVPENDPPPSYRKTGKFSDFPNTWEGRPDWKAEAFAMLARVMDSIDVDASNEVYNAFGELKEAITKAKPEVVE